MTVSAYLIALGLTVLIELVVALAFDRSWKLLRCVVLVNLFSHPIFGYTLWVLPRLGVPITMPLVLATEAIIVVAEAGLLIFAMPERSRWFFFGLSLCMNATSYLLGGWILEHL